MGWRSLPLKRLAISGLILLSIGGISGCGENRAYEEAIEEAELGVASLLEIATTRTADLLSTRTALDEVTDVDIAATFVNDMRGYNAGSPGPAEKSAVFDMGEESDGTVTFSVFFGSSAYRAGGLVTTNQSRHSCGTLTGRFGQREVGVEDLPCPPEIAAFAGEDSLAVSMTENATRHGMQLRESP